MTNRQLYFYELSSQQHKKTTLQSLGMTYRQYLNTNHWRNFREVILRQRDFTCEGCGAFSHLSSKFAGLDLNNIEALLITLEIHHEDYHNLGREKPEDVMVLCRDCHQLCHDAIEDFMFTAHMEFESDEP